MLFDPNNFENHPNANFYKICSVFSGLDTGDEYTHTDVYIPTHIIHLKLFKTTFWAHETTKWIFLPATVNKIVVQSLYFIYSLVNILWEGKRNTQKGLYWSSGLL